MTDHVRTSDLVYAAYLIAAHDCELTGTKPDEEAFGRVTFVFEGVPTGARENFRGSGMVPARAFHDAIRLLRRRADETLYRHRMVQPQPGNERRGGR